MNPKHFHVSSFVLGLVFGAVCVGLWFFGGKLVPPSSDTTLATSTVPTITGSASGAIAVSDQVAGTSVLVDSVTVPPPGVWVAVRETGMGSDLGNILGAARARGPLSGLSISLLRPTQPGHVYAIELYRVDTDGDFDPIADSVYVDFDTGQRVVALFTAK